MNLLDVGPEPDPSFDRYARIVQQLLNVPVALVSIVEAEQQVFPGAVGLPAPWQDDRRSPLTHSFCQYVVKDGAPLIVTDARLDERLKDNLAIVDLHVIAYAGFPITDSHGTAVGSLCAIDVGPRRWTAAELQTLQDLAATVSTEFALRELRAESNAAAARARGESDRSQVLLALSETLAHTLTVADIAAGLQDVAAHLGCNHAGIWIRHDDRDRGLHYVEHPTLSWPQAARAADLPVDASNPVGATVSGRRPLFYRDRADQDRDFPAYASPPSPGDGQARAFMPLTIGGKRFGVLALLWPRPRSFSADDRITIAALASYTAQALQRARLLDERTTVASTLQAAMLTALPQPDDLDLAARYRTATHDQVGGDWYDAVVMPGGDTNVVIGDVMGHDIAAAATMGQLRNMLRALAWALHDPPSVNLTRLDRAARDIKLEARSTLVFGRIEQTVADRQAGRRRLRWSNAGHPPPLLVDGSGAVTVLDDGQPADALLGFRPDRPRRDQTVAITNGSTLLLYTDGLIESRTSELDVGLARLSQALGRYHHLPVGTMLDAILAELVPAEPDDDVAVLAVRFNPQR
jgi:serine phosphatase RsbU (regulator of sigma subunit)